MTKIGYARVSTARQDEQSQIQALKDAGCEKIFHERISTRTPEEQREQLQACLGELQKGDTLVLMKLDRLGRSQHEVITRLHALQEREIHIQTLDNLINTESLGKFAPIIIGLLTGLAEVERELIRERTLESIEHRRATGGDLGGRPKSYSPEQADLVRELRLRGDSFRKIARATRLSVGTIQRILGEAA